MLFFQNLLRKTKFQLFAVQSYRRMPRPPTPTVVVVVGWECMTQSCSLQIDQAEDFQESVRDEAGFQISTRLNRNGNGPRRPVGISQDQGPVFVKSPEKEMSLATSIISFCRLGNGGSKATSENHTRTTSVSGAPVETGGSGMSAVATSAYPWPELPAFTAVPRTQIAQSPMAGTFT